MPTWCGVSVGVGLLEAGAIITAAQKMEYII